MPGRSAGGRLKRWHCPRVAVMAGTTAKCPCVRRPPVPDEKRPEHMDGELQASVHYANHDLREMFSRDNAERRRSGGKMLRAKLTAAQDKKCMNKMVRIREEFEVSNSDDIVLRWVQTQVEEGNGEGIDAELLELAAKVVFAPRSTPWDDEAGH